MKILRNKWLMAAALVAVIAVVVGFTLNRNPQPNYFTAKVQRSTINDVVQATGTINAVTTVQVGSQVSGTISKLYVDFNSRVRKGQVIAEIEPSLFRGALEQAEADLQNSRANLAAAQAGLVKAEATAVQTKADYERTAGLAKEGVMSPQQLDLAKANGDTAQAAVVAAEATVKQAAAQIALKQAAVNVAQTNLNHTIITAPIDGIVVARNVDVGQTVAASLQAPTLFNIAQDLTKMQVDTQTDESDVGNMKVGQDAKFKVDAYPRDVFHGRVKQVRLNPTTVQNVVTYDTVIAFDNPQFKLFPGMTAYVTIPVASAEDVLAVSNMALRFKPNLKPEELRALYQNYGISSGRQSKATQAGTGVTANPQNAGTSQSVGGRPQSAASHEPMLDVGVVWKVRADKTLEPVQIKTGITDHTETQVAQVLKGTLQPGDTLAIGELGSAKRPSGPGANVMTR